MQIALLSHVVWLCLPVREEAPWPVIVSCLVHRVGSLVSAVVHSQSASKTPRRPFARLTGLALAALFALGLLTVWAGPLAAPAAAASTGSVAAWGSDSVGQTDVPAGLSGVSAIAAGIGFSLALKSDGTVVAWGTDSAGQTNVPTSLSGVTAIAAGWFHALALKSNGTVVAWGDNTYGQGAVPTGLSGVTAIAAGDEHSLALKSDGTVIAWGTNGSGQTSVPTGLSGVIAIAAGGFHNLALKSNGTVVAWGLNSSGQATVPTGLSGVTAIAAGGYHSLALNSGGTVVAWGDNTYGQAAVPTGLSGVTAIAAGEYHSLALESNGTVVGWGSNGAGQTNIPTGLSGVTAIAAGGFHSLALESGPAAATALAVSGLPSPTTAGVAHTVTVTAKDGSGNTATGYLGRIHFTSTDPAAVLPADYTFAAGDAGVHTFSVTLKTPGTQSVTATDTVTASITGSQTGIVVQAAAATALAVSGLPSPTTAGVAHTVTVTAKDGSGNTATGYLGRIHFTSTDPAAVLPADYTFTAGDAGVHTFTVTLKTPGTQSVTATDTVTASITGLQSGIVVQAVGVTSGATYFPLTPTRILDSRTSTGGLPGPFSSHVARTFGVTGVGGVPSNATAVTGNLTVTGQTSNGYLFIGPVAMNNPTSSTLNFPAGDDRANAVTVALGAGGTLSVTMVAPSSGNSAYVIFDVTGYFVPAT